MFLFLSIIIVMLCIIAGIYVHDVMQKEHTILRNYPVIGHFRYFAEQWGEYMRQYQYLPDWEERPFNRLERSWVYRSAKGVSNLISFGSEVTPVFAFRNAAFPVLEEDKKSFGGKQIGIADGPGACALPYHATSFFNISGMSFGALSHAAVLALSRGAAKAGIWMSTGEGGLSPYHLEGGCDIVFQIGTAKYGVRDEDGNLSDERLREVAAHAAGANVRGKARPGRQARQGRHAAGCKGQRRKLPSIRGIPEHEASISPNRHKDIGQLPNSAPLLRAFGASPASRLASSSLSAMPNFSMTGLPNAAEPRALPRLHRHRRRRRRHGRGARGAGRSHGHADHTGHSDGRSRRAPGTD